MLLLLLLVLFCNRYRVRDAWFRCTSAAIRDVRKKELRQELLTSKKLEYYFEDNPRELQILKHAKASHALPHIVSGVFFFFFFFVVFSFCWFLQLFLKLGVALDVEILWCFHVLVHVVIYRNLVAVIVFFFSPKKNWGPRTTLNLFYLVDWINF